MSAQDPLVPAEVDLRDFQFMPLDVRRLRDSRLVTAFPAEHVVAAVMLWCASWHQVPAASLPDDDVELAQLAGYGRAVAVFKKLKDGALHQFVKCNDGRLYHPVVAEKAIGAWQAKVDTAHRRDRDRYRKANGKEAPFPDVDKWNSERISNGIGLEFRWNASPIPTEPIHHSNGKQKDSTTTAPHLPDKGEGEGDIRDRDRDRDRETLKEPKEKKRTRSATALAVYDRPSWLPPEWETYLQMRREKGVTLAPTWLASCLKQLDEWNSKGIDVAGILRNSLTNGYTGLFPPRGGGNGASSNQLIADEWARSQSPIEGESRIIDA